MYNGNKSTHLDNLDENLPVRQELHLHTDKINKNPVKFIKPDDETSAKVPAPSYHIKVLTVGDLHTTLCETA
jgi:hypothetical protein